MSGTLLRGKQTIAGGDRSGIERKPAKCKSLVCRVETRRCRTSTGSRSGGTEARLQPGQLQQLDQALREGARAHGFATDLWTLPRVAKVIERLTGVHYHPGYVWKILKATRWTLQEPATQARECIHRR
jgi:transposase